MVLIFSVFIMFLSGMFIICFLCTMLVLLISKVIGLIVFFTLVYCNDLLIDYFIDIMIKEFKRGKVFFIIILFII